MKPQDVSNESKSHLDRLTHSLLMEAAQRSSEEATGRESTSPALTFNVGERIERHSHMTDELQRARSTNGSAFIGK